MFLRKAGFSTSTADERIGRHTAAALLAVSTRTLHRWSQEGFGPVPARHGNWEIRYNKAEVLQWATKGRLRRPRNANNGKRLDTNSACHDLVN
jgi:predicted site-specific integrase-resolvase